MASPLLAPAAEVDLAACGSTRCTLPVPGWCSVAGYCPMSAWMRVIQLDSYSEAKIRAATVAGSNDNRDQRLRQISSESSLSDCYKGVLFLPRLALNLTRRAAERGSFIGSSANGTVSKIVFMG